METIADINCIGLCILIYNQISIEFISERRMSNNHESRAIQLTEASCQKAMCVLIKTITILFIPIVREDTIIRRIKEHKVIRSRHVKNDVVINVHYLRMLKQVTVLLCY